jgi:hypothetical protein
MPNSRRKLENSRSKYARHSQFPFGFEFEEMCSANEIGEGEPAANEIVGMT